MGFLPSHSLEPSYPSPITKSVHSPVDAAWLPLLTFILEIRCRVPSSDVSLALDVKPRLYKSKLGLCLCKPGTILVCWHFTLSAPLRFPTDRQESGLACFQAGAAKFFCDISAITIASSLHDVKVSAAELECRSSVGTVVRDDPAGV